MSGQSPAKHAGLSKADIDALLRRTLIGRLATIDSAGYPAIVPIWHDWDGTAISIVARALSGFVADIRREPRVGFSVVADDDPDLRIQIRGRAQIAEGPGPLEGAMLTLARRLAERYEGASGLIYVEASRSLERCLVRITPDRILSWGSPEWHSRYLAPAQEDSG